jgi:metal-dependent amidase/aminoacylase/carboxypeptidase family protein
MAEVDLKEIDPADVDLKEVAREAIESKLASLVGLSHTIHGHPETAFEEERAAEWTAGALADGGFDVTRGIAGLSTAFYARCGSGPSQE